jgi:hypothetical protein
MMEIGHFCCKFIKISLFLFAISSAVLVGGCAQERVWTKKGLNQNEFDRDLARCDREAASSTQIVGYAYSTDLERGLERSIAKENLIKKCMYSKGYTFESK